LPALEQVPCDGGFALRKGVAAVQAERQQTERQPLADQLDHFHTLCAGSQGVRRLEQPVRKALAEAETAQAQVERGSRQGQSLRGISQRARLAWRATRAMDAWQERAVKMVMLERSFPLEPFPNKGIEGGMRA